MGFDPVTLALAKQYTDEKVGNGNGGGVTNIDLDKYGIGSALLGLFAQGGGETTIENIYKPEHLTAFWDVASGNPLNDIVLILSLGVTALIIRGVTKAFDNATAQCSSISFSFLADVDGTNAYMLNVQVIRHGEAGARILMNVS